MRPFDKFKEIDARLAALEAENSELKARLAALERPKLGPIVPDAMEQVIAGKASVSDFVWTLRDDPEELPAKWSDQLTAPIVDSKQIASATIAPLPAKRRSRPPKTA